ncbi:hypothetical protein BDV38DRAFT_281920 [Aspergillus pseudotamarii]|uniref:Uncharacterized protein n=1 Tax=Aspergillus pseudotamarii TaxID=132259 RepID=A0A5N6SXI2_ASPPS|nr:uncharacterized protein BDV38DRAFT_281920 [Aspergillus pseudotamarii]KAE8138617.1 hypothetical protein BDV38DRAFT_281920 [Aspergillus pseudotamarii]
MKTNFFLIIAAVAAGVLAHPEANIENNLAARSGTCHKPSSCSKFWAGKCEQYCAPYKFSHMTDDGCHTLAQNRAKVENVGDVADDKCWRRMAEGMGET